MSKSNKDLKNIKMTLPTSLQEINPDINIIMCKTELIILEYIESSIYKSKLSSIVKTDLDKAFTSVRNKLL